MRFPIAHTAYITYNDDVGTHTVKLTSLCDCIHKGAQHSACSKCKITLYLNPYERPKILFIGFGEYLFYVSFNIINSYASI